MSTSFDFSNDDIDPAVLADVTRIVQELMRMQQQDLGIDQQQQQHQQRMDLYQHNDDLPLSHLISSTAGDCSEHDDLSNVNGKVAMDHSDSQDMHIDVALLSAQQVGKDEKDKHKQDKERKQGGNGPGCSSSFGNSDQSSLPSSSSLSSFSSSSAGSSLSLSSFHTVPATSPSSSSVAAGADAQFNDSVYSKPNQTINTTYQAELLVLPASDMSKQSINDAGAVQVLASLLPGQKTPTRATQSAEAPATDPDEHASKDKDLFGAATPLIVNNAPVPVENAITKSPSKSSTVVPRPIPLSPIRPRRKKALLIGINYFGDPNQLLGCINDTRDVFGFLNGYFGFRYQDTIMLTDDQIYEDKRPTGANIRYWMKWLVKDAEPQDSLFFHYAGHGGRIKDFSYNGKAEHLGDEADGYDEIIYPCDYLRSGIISDDEMYDLMVKELPAGVQLTALVDACHSGTMLDLPYIYNGNHITALEKVTRTKVGAMAAMSASAVEFDLPGSNNNSNVTTTTTTTTTTTVTMTSTSSAGPNPVVSQFANGSAISTSGSLSPTTGLPLINTKEDSSPLMSPGQTHSNRSIVPDKDELNDSYVAEEPTDSSVTKLAVAESISNDTRVKACASAAPTLELNGASLLSISSSSPGNEDDGLKPLSGGCTKSINTAACLNKKIMPEAVDNDDVENHHRGIECDAQEWVGPVDAPSAVASATLPNVEVDHADNNDADMEEARRMALFRETKGNVVMFSGCRDDQASADIRASAKDAAIIADHHKALATTNWGSPTAMNAQDDNMPNPLGYSLPQPYTSPMARGAVSYAWIQCLSQKPSQTYEELLVSMRYFMKQRDLEQVPQLGSGMPMDMRAVFSL
ncbi:Ca(2+)-dependent cysteine protease [Mortierella claussenii]|nr:Ca(2+)-dependent cysteine protease [Mortierella claussenii]